MTRSLPLLALLFACSGDKTHPHDSSDPGADGADGGDTAEAWRPDLVCPGDAGCASSAGELRAGAAKRSITPPCFETW